MDQDVIVAALQGKQYPPQGLMQNVQNLSAQRNNFDPLNAMIGLGGMPAGGAGAAFIGPGGLSERIRAAAYRMPNGKIFEGMNHGDAAEQVAKAHGSNLESFVFPQNGEEGFMTNTGRFVDRREAKEIGDAAGQINEDMRTNYPGLISEDLKEGEMAPQQQQFQTPKESRLQRKAEGEQAPTPSEVIDQVAVRYKPNMQIKSGVDYPEKLRNDFARALQLQSNYPESQFQTGYLTNRQRFVTPEQAYGIAKSKGQINSDSYSNIWGELHPEDAVKMLKGGQ